MTRSWWTRTSAVAVFAGASLWTAAGIVIVWQPPAMAVARVYTTLVPAALACVLIGLAGLDVWMGGGRPRRRARRSGLTSAVLAMSSRRHSALDAIDGLGQEQLSARRIGVGCMRVGGVAVVIASLLLQGEVGTLRSLLFLGWLVFLAGVLCFGIAVMTSALVPRAAGWLLLAGSLLVLSPVAAMLSGATRRPELLGPLLPAELGIPVAALGAWLCLGAGLAWIGVALWRASRSAVPASSPH